MRCSSEEWRTAAAVRGGRLRAASSGSIVRERPRLAAPAGIGSHFDAGRPMPLKRDELPKALASGFEVGELIEARASGRQQHDLAASSRLPGLRHGPLQLAAFVYLDIRTAECLGDQRGVLADQIHRPAAALDRSAQRREVLVLALASEDQMDRPAVT